MTTTLKVLGQSSPAANTDTTLYTVPGATQTIVSSVTICNQNATAQLFRMAIRVGGAGISSPQYIYYDASIPPNDTLTATLGITLAATDVVTVRANSTLISFNLFGQEIS